MLFLAGYTNKALCSVAILAVLDELPGAGGWGGGGVLPYMSYVGMCRCEGYGFQAVYSSIGYIN